MSEEEGPPEAGVAHINEFGKEHFQGVLHCSWTANKGRIVHATRAFREGEVILVESPLHVVQEQETSPAFKKLKRMCKEHGDEFDYEPLWYWCAIQSLTGEQLKGAKVQGITASCPKTQHRQLLLHHDEVHEPGVAAKAIARDLCPSADPVIIERLIQVWVLNCFEYSDSPQGYSQYFFSSFMSHSCFPNAVWHYDGADHVLRCRRDIQPGDEVCISYLPESGLLQAAPSRRKELSDTKLFWCDCERCMPGVSDLSRGFRCPKCSEGQVFAQTPVAGAAKSASLLAEHFVGAVCLSCKHAVSKAESSKFADLEKQLQEKVDKYTAARSARVEQLLAEEKFIDRHFTQHFLADLAWEQFIAQYAANGTKRMADQLRLLQRRCSFHRSAYPGLSGARAWALEALGDCLRKSDKVPEAAAKGEPVTPKECYEEALAVLRSMFGNDHEYVSGIEEKLAELG